MIFFIDGMLHTECIVCAMSKTLHQSHRLTGNSVRPRLVVEKVKSKLSNIFDE